MWSPGTELTLREQVVAVCHRLHARGLIAGAEGNVSVRLDAEHVLVTPAGADKANVRADDLLVIPLTATTAAGDIVRPAGANGGPGRDSPGRPSSEVEMHRTCYACRPDVGAVVHAHPPVSTGMATAGVGIPANIVAELPAVVGPVALVPYGRPGTPDLSAGLEPVLHSHEVFLLANHGVTAIGRNLDDALQRLESTEQAARIFLVARLLGGAVTLSDREVSALGALHPRHAAHSNSEPTA